MNVFFYSCLSGYIHISISELTVIQYSCLYSSKSLGRCNQTSNDSYGIFCQFPMEIFHCVFTSFYAIFICNNISNGIVYISWIALAVYDYMDFLNGNLLIYLPIYNFNLYNKQTFFDRALIIVDLQKIEKDLQLKFCIIQLLVLYLFLIALT